MRVNLVDVQNHTDAKSMARDIRAALEAVVQNNSHTILGYMNALTHSVREVEIVMAGGGATIDFIRTAVGRPFSLDRRHLQATITETVADDELNLFGAGRERMAVALGGARSEYDDLIHKQIPLKRISRGPL